MARRKTLRPGDGHGRDRRRVRRDGGDLDGLGRGDPRGARAVRAARGQQLGPAVAGRVLPRIPLALGAAHGRGRAVLRVPERRCPERLGPAACEFHRAQRRE